MKRSRKSVKNANISGKEYCDICKSQNFLEIHHINGRNIPKPNHSSNLCNICPSCHYKVHLGKIIIERWTMTSNGLILFWHNKDEENITGEKAVPPIIKLKE